MDRGYLNFPHKKSNKTKSNDRIDKMTPKTNPAMMNYTQMAVLYLAT